MEPVPTLSAPKTSALCSMVVVPVAPPKYPVPAMERIFVGVVVPTPTLPAESMRKRSEPAVERLRVSAADDHIPLFVSPVNAIPGAPTEPRGKRAEVVNVGVVPKTITPVPVSSDISPAMPTDVVIAEITPDAPLKSPVRVVARVVCPVTVKVPLIVALPLETMDTGAKNIPSTWRFLTT